MKYDRKKCVQITMETVNAETDSTFTTFMPPFHRREKFSLSVSSTEEFTAEEEKPDSFLKSVLIQGSQK